MPYTINKFNNEPLVVLEDGTIDTTTSLGLVGRNYVGYGETQNENFVFLLENFANNAAPSRPLVGQTWFNTTNNILYSYDGSGWKIVGSAQVDDAAPTDPASGSLWLDTAANQLKVWTGTEWAFVGPEAAEGFGITRARSYVITDATSVERPVILLTIDTAIIGIISGSTFTINPSNPIVGFSNIVPGLNMSTAVTVKGTLTGNADTATKLASIRTINGTAFDGTANITIKSSTTRSLIKGAYLTGNDFDGSTEQTWGVDASSANVAGKVVARNASGGFAASIVTADLVGNVTAPAGTSTFDVVQATEFIGASLSGNAKTATKFQTTRKINGVNFDGTSDVTVPASAETLTGIYISPSVRYSQLENVGTLEDLSVAEAGISVGSAQELRFYTNNGVGIAAKNELSINLVDANVTGGKADLRFMPSATSLAAGGENTATIAPNIDASINLGHAVKAFDKVYANNFIGNADTATLANQATNIAGGGAGSIPYQTAGGTTGFLPAGTPGYVLKAGSDNSIMWDALALERLSAGDYITYTGAGSTEYYNTMSPLTISVDADTANTANKVVARDENGDFSAGTITATLSGNASTATTLQTARNINGVAFNGSADITITATDPTKVPLAGGTLTGFLTLNAAPTSSMHAANKSYVDSRLPQFTFTYGNTAYSISGYTNQVGSWNNGANYVDVFPPSEKTMANLVAFIPSIAVIHYAGGVDGNDSLRCTWSTLSDRIRIYVQNTEQRSTPAANWLAVWS